jgi:hypothetical protein
VQHQGAVGVVRPVLHPGNSQRAAFVVIDIDIPWSVGKFRKGSKVIVWCSQRLNAREDIAGSAVDMPERVSAMVAGCWTTAN